MFKKGFINLTYTVTFLSAEVRAYTFSKTHDLHPNQDERNCSAGKENVASETKLPVILVLPVDFPDCTSI